MIKKQQLEDKESYEKEKEEWLAQRIEIEQDLNNFKNKIKDNPTELPKFIGETTSLNSGSNITFSLNEEKWVKLLKATSNFKLPQLNYYQLYYVPEDSDEIEGSKYIEELKEVAKRTTNYLYVYFTNFSSKEFCELVSAAKNVMNLYFCYDLIPLDEECDFGSDMDGCKIEYLYFNYSGNSNYSNWSQNPNRLENLIAAIAECGPLTKSLKYLYIQYCDIAKEKAQEMLNKYKLNGVTLYA